MARYFSTWHVVRERMADDPATIASGWKMLMEMVKADFDSGTLKEWGAFPGSLGGYSVIEGTEMDVMKFTMQYAPYIAFEVRPLVSAAEAEEFISAAAAG
ncbi:MAG: hypothetical protein JSW51_03470 [Gemmatimonadota bacterium]|nr:MAG: hypothetical protein JSW51_03470 [Gemmatimonadota bacterium]